LCVYDERLVVGGSSPSTISLYDLETGQPVSSVSLTMDIRNAIHGLEVWPYQ
jgi:WD40 repeat protein